MGVAIKRQVVFLGCGAFIFGALFCAIAVGFVFLVWCT